MARFAHSALEASCLLRTSRAGAMQGVCWVVRTRAVPLYNWLRRSCRSQTCQHVSDEPSNKLLINDQYPLLQRVSSFPEDPLTSSPS